MQLKPDTSVQSVKKFIVNVLSILAYKNTEPGIIDAKQSEWTHQLITIKLRNNVNMNEPRLLQRSGGTQTTPTGAEYLQGMIRLNLLKTNNVMKKTK